jgi:hypothetical protein
VELLLLV